MDALTPEVVIAAILALGAAVKGLQMLGVLPAGPVAEAAAQRADQAERELAKMIVERDALRSQRDLSPILEMLATGSKVQTEILDRLVAFNGSLKHTNASLESTREGLETAVEAIKFLAGQIVTDQFPAKPRARSARKAS